ncbi:PQQ-binding-like beta-propeller repeat protein [Legionella gratiana]|nr:PQQ-binding-like beta-propeller repeat protein [Legionella gratiana]
MAYWHQYQANASSQGYVPFSTHPASSPKWQIEVGPVAFASPVIGLDGTVYIGNLTGELHAIGSDGILRWRRQLDVRGSFISGQANGTLALYDLVTGDELWKPWYKAKKAIQSPPASFINQIYLISDTHVILLDGSGRFIKEFQMSTHSLGAALGSPGISANQVYVNAQEGLFSLSLDLNSFTKNSITPGGVSSIAIGEDGTIYLADRNKRLWAFSE